MEKDAKKKKKKTGIINPTLSDCSIFRRLVEAFDEVLVKIRRD